MTTCLIVDDSAVIRKIIRNTLEEMGFICTEAENGLAAEQKCRSAMPDVILLDWNMPVMTGIDFLKVLRGLPDGTHPTVIFCTTENDMDHIRKALEAGANDFIMKPFDAELMRSKLEQNAILPLHS